jgi:uncharacterized membrane protein
MELIKTISVYLQAFAYIAAGINHFWNSKFYLKIMPKWLPYPDFLHLSSGVFEIIFGLALLVPAMRLWGAYGIISLLVVFFLVHTDHLIHPPKMAYSIIVFRFILQFFLIGWAYWISC